MTMMDNSGKNIADREWTTMEFLNALLELCENYKLSVTSWLRSKEHNAAIDGVPNSQHLKGLAVDVVLDDPTLALTFMQEAVHFGLQATNEKTHIHVQAPRQGQGAGIFRMKSGLL